MPQLKETMQGEGGPKIGPVATDLLFENDDVKIWQMDRGPGETFWHHYHNYDYVLFQITDLFGANDGEQEHQRVWEADRSRRRARPAKRRARALCFRRNAFFISPAPDGFLRDRLRTPQHYTSATNGITSVPKRSSERQALAGSRPGSWVTTINSVNSYF
jgi:hypothetical protein